MFGVWRVGLSEVLSRQSCRQHLRAYSSRRAVLGHARGLWGLVSVMRCPAPIAEQYDPAGGVGLQPGTSAPSVPEVV